MSDDEKGDSYLVVSQLKLLRLVETLSLANELLADVLGTKLDTPSKRRGTSRVNQLDFAPSPSELSQQLREHGGNVAAVARHYSRAPMQVRRWIRRYGIELDSFRGDRAKASG